MLAGEAGTTPGERVQCHRGTFVLTNPAADLSCRGNGDTYFQGNYDYHAHAQVYTGGADPLGSQGYASVTRNPSSSSDAAREANSSRAFLFMGRNCTESVLVSTTKKYEHINA